MTSDRTAVVGGGAAGIGHATARALVHRGYRVVITGRNEASLADATAKLRAEPVPHADHEPEVSYLVSDIAAPDSAAATVADVEARWGGIDVVVANAGGPAPARILELTDGDWEAAAQLLLFGPLRLARATVPAMAERGFGRFIVVTSAQVRQPDPDLAPSVVLRSAMTSAAKLLSREFGDRGVTVNCVAPGATDTDRRRQVLERRAAATGASLADLSAADSSSVPTGRPGRPEEIAAAIAFLASDEASYVNGTVLAVDGGKTEAV